MNLTFNSDVTLEADSERPSETEEALQADVRVGWREGSPVVGTETVSLGEDPSEAYSHYVRNGELLLPQAGEFVRELFAADEITSVEEAAEELQTDAKTVRKAAELHDVSIPEGEGATTEEANSNTLPLPNGEGVPLDMLRDPPHTDSRILHSLLGRYGMSASEVTLYLSEHTHTNPSESDVRQAAAEVGISD